jgi:hypothetical protein
VWGVNEYPEWRNGREQATPEMEVEEQGWELIWKNLTGRGELSRKRQQAWRQSEAKFVVINKQAERRRDRLTSVVKFYQDRN